ncbi:hypothetical protein QN277_007831 [Acacia crassicarpa]|uniref:Uncharacterized protein n=1 Tax=Acacia crassicarpa TaxID=499986 RepID=A0AAE1IXU8_9FABA|nr:hypothetical protein QN277_007831 [Acacia crassicarpa]
MKKAYPYKSELLRNAKSLLSGIKSDEKHTKRKKRWLLGIATTKYDRKNFKKAKFLKDRFLPESSLREDDIFYESVRTYVEGLSGVCNIEGEFDAIQDDMLSVDMPSIKKLLSCLDNMTIRGLYLLAEIISGDSVKLKRTRCELKRIVKSFLSSALSNQNHNCYQREILRQLFELIHASRSQFGHATVEKVFGDLTKFSAQTLNAMHRKLKGEKTTTPQLRSGRKSWRSRNVLIMRVREISKEMRSKFDKGDELPEPLAKAMVVANLSLKLANHKDIFLNRFDQLASEANSLQDDIMKAIWRLENVSKLELKRLRLLSETKPGTSEKLFRIALKELLTEYLFQCDDLDIPKSILDSLDVINGSSVDGPLQSIQEEKIKQEVENILNFSSGTKQLAFDLLLDYGFDEDFEDAYMKQLVESDGDDDYEDSQMGETNCFSNGDCEAEESEPTRNQYHALQDACDQTSMLTHKLIGGMLWEFAKLEGLNLNKSQNLYLTGDNQIEDVKGKRKRSPPCEGNSVIVRAIEMLAPLSDSAAMERLKKIMS